MDACREALIAIEPYEPDLLPGRVERQHVGRVGNHDVLRLCLLELLPKPALERGVQTDGGLIEGDHRGRLGAQCRGECQRLPGTCAGKLDRDLFDGAFLRGRNGAHAHKRAWLTTHGGVLGRLLVMVRGSVVRGSGWLSAHIDLSAMGKFAKAFLDLPIALVVSRM